MTVVTASLSLVLQIFVTSVDSQSFKINDWNNVWKSGIYGVPAVGNVFNNKKK